jgi:uncharacterized protein with NRDE domain
MIALAWHHDANWPLLLIANRDEFHARPSLPLAEQSEPVGMLAGTDLSAGGHWLGILPDGRFAAVTNARLGPAAARPPAPRARGELVRQALAGAIGQPSGIALPSMAKARDYGPFSLLAGGPEALTHRSNSFPEQRRLAPGIHVLSNGPMNADWPKARRARAALVDQLALAEVEHERLLDHLADDTPAADAELPDTGVGLALERRLSPLFLRDPVYGTRCSTVVAVDRAGIVRVWERSYDAAGRISGERAFVSDSSSVDSERRCWRAGRSN